MSRTPKPTPEAQSTDAFDQGRDGELRIRASKLKCPTAFFRAIETCRKYQAKRRAEGRARTGEYARLTAKDQSRDQATHDQRPWRSQTVRITFLLARSLAKMIRTNPISMKPRSLYKLKSPLELWPILASIRDLTSQRNSRRGPGETRR